MRKVLNGILINWVLNKVEDRPAPHEIPMGDARSLSNDFFTLHIGSPLEDGHLLFEKRVERGVEGLWFSGPGGGLPCTLLKEAYSEMPFIITHYYKDYVFYHKSAFEFALNQAINRAIWTRKFDLVKQRFYNNKTLVRRDRMYVLRVFVEKSVVNSDFRMSDVSLLVELYGRRWIRHPQRDAILGYYRLVLDSLVASQDLTNDSYVYRLAPRALATLDQFEQDEERHSDNRAIQNRIALVTLMMFLAAIAQVIVTVWEKKNPDRAPVEASVEGELVYPIEPPSFPDE